jgi:hypothetical protein
MEFISEFLQQENRQLRDDLSCLREEMNEMEEKFEEQLRLALRDSEISAQTMRSKDDRSGSINVL